MSAEPDTIEETPTRPGRLVVVDDEVNVGRVLATYFAREGWEVQQFEKPQDALEAITAEADVVITDLQMPGMTGIQLLSAIRGKGLAVPVLVITGYGSVENAVQALKQGAFDYLCKPFEFEQVKLAVQRAYLHRQLQRENEHLQEELEDRFRFGNIVGASPKMLQVYALIEKAARSQATVLLLGESGTGKELVARALHYNGPRKNKRFVAVSCAALPSELLESELFGHEKGAFTGANWQRTGRFELADGGTLFLDEIGDISLNVQTKLLRVLQEREIDRVGGSKPIKVDVRLVAATNRDLEEAIRKGEFREDLYYRLRVVEIRLPPLRERREDIPLLARHFLEKFAQREGRQVTGFSPSAMELLESYSWPGNIRELENCIEHALVMADESARLLTPDHLPDAVVGERGGEGSGPATASSLADALSEYERNLILKCLDEHRWDLAETAAALGMSVRALSQSVRRLNLRQDLRDSSAIG